MGGDPQAFSRSGRYFDTAERMAQHEAIFIGESTFRAGKAGIDDVVNALKKVQAHAQELVGMV